MKRMLGFGFGASAAGNAASGASRRAMKADRRKTACQADFNKT
jgi:hypothetical protein